MLSNKKPPLNNTAWKVLEILFEELPVQKQKAEYILNITRRVESLLTFKNVIQHKWYKIKLKWWRRINDIGTK